MYDSRLRSYVPFHEAHVPPDTRTRNICACNMQFAHVLHVARVPLRAFLYLNTPPRCVSAMRFRVAEQPRERLSRFYLRDLLRSRHRARRSISRIMTAIGNSRHSAADKSLEIYSGVGSWKGRSRRRDSSYSWRRG
jgi:hypothetical protein